MGQTRPKSIPNVSDEKLLLDLDQLTYRIDNGDETRGNLVRLAAKRTLVIFELDKRNAKHNYTGPVGSLEACRAIFGLPN